MVDIAGISSVNWGVSTANANWGVELLMLLLKAIKLSFYFYFEGEYISYDSMYLFDNIFWIIFFSITNIANILKFF